MSELFVVGISHKNVFLYMPKCLSWMRQVLCYSITTTSCFLLLSLFLQPTHYCRHSFILSFWWFCLVEHTLEMKFIPERIYVYDARYALLYAICYVYMWVVVTCSIFHDADLCRCIAHSTESYYKMNYNMRLNQLHMNTTK